MKTINNINDLHNTIKTIRENAIYSIFCQIIFHDILKHYYKSGDLPDISQKLPEGPLTLKDFISRNDNLSKNNLLTLKQNVNRDVVKHMFKETFRLTQSFCKSKYPEFESQDYYHFARFIVNYLSHDFKIQCRSKKDKAILPLRYNDYEITEDSIGKSFNITLDELVSINDKIICFVTSLTEH